MSEQLERSFILAIEAVEDEKRKSAQKFDEQLRRCAERLLKRWESAQIDDQPMVECLEDLREYLALTRRS